MNFLERRKRNQQLQDAIALLDVHLGSATAPSCWTGLSTASRSLGLSNKDCSTPQSNVKPGQPATPVRQKPGPHPHLRPSRHSHNRSPAEDDARPRRRTPVCMTFTPTTPLTLHPTSVRRRGARERARQECGTQAILHRHRVVLCWGRRTRKIAKFVFP